MVESGDGCEFGRISGMFRGEFRGRFALRDLWRGEGVVEVRAERDVPVSSCLGAGAGGEA